MTHFPRIYMDETITRLKKFATLLPKLLAETPEALAEKERISEINWNFLKRKKLQANSIFIELACSWNGCMMQPSIFASFNQFM
ncbi:hypothetical protein ACQKKK_23340 [Peribacillus sp. NPDC006672]|uniref:hypothetical protein n=1 Tax=Peribacillus sp. NPDC006672 TaxID=3390606 RepID=UPI003D01CB08